MNKTNTSNFNKIIENIILDKKHIYYCSIAGIADIDRSLAISILRAKDGVIKASNSNDFDTNIKILIDACSKFNNYYPSELLTFLFFSLSRMCEFYYASKIIYLLYKYFKSGNKDHIDSLDMPYYNQAKMIAINRLNMIESCFEKIIEDNDFSELQDYAKSEAYAIESKDFDKIKNDIEKYYSFKKEIESNE